MGRKKGSASKNIFGKHRSPSNPHLKDNTPYKANSNPNNIKSKILVPNLLIQDGLIKFA